MSTNDEVIFVTEVQTLDNTEGNMEIEILHEIIATLSPQLEESAAIHNDTQEPIQSSSEHPNHNIHVTPQESKDYMSLEYLTGTKPQCTIQNCTMMKDPHDKHGEIR